jgi:glycogen operon protein
LIETGSAESLGARVDRSGINFAVYAAEASRVELCLFDANGQEAQRFDLPGLTNGIWHGFVPGLTSGQRYGFRAHGRFEPEAGLRFNPQKLLLDPYARELSGPVIWCDAIFDYDRRKQGESLVPSNVDSRAFMPKCVAHDGVRPQASKCRIPWSDMLIYELNVRGFSMRHPAIDQLERGHFSALATAPVLQHLKSLGVTSVELMPIHAFTSEEFLVRRGLRNFWGYNTLCFFAPEARYLGSDGLAGLRRAVDALHDEGIEVLLDVVYNHTAEGGKLGPCLSFRGLANTNYYRLVPNSGGEYINDTGCGNTINSDDPITRRLIVDSLRYWVCEFGIDGFRFDLATILGRKPHGFSDQHPLFADIAADAVLKDVKLIAEPWDVGPGGYQLGAFPKPWAEWNDRYRDALRQFWRRDPGVAPEFARRVHGSADVFEPSQRGPAASVNFVASHDGFTVADVVSYVERHNEANGEHNRDGHAHNFSSNHGVEGPTANPAIKDARRRHRLNLLATLLFSQGTPMLLGGDEFGNSQSGNNNAYAQDNDIGWLDWRGLQDDPAFFDEVCMLARVRRELPLLRQLSYRHGDFCTSTGRADIEWFGVLGLPIAEHEWSEVSALGVLLSRPDQSVAADDSVLAVSLLYNASDAVCEFRLPQIQAAGHWRSRYSSAGFGTAGMLAGVCTVPSFSLACLSYQ